MRVISDESLIVNSKEPESSFPPQHKRKVQQQVVKLSVASLDTYINNYDSIILTIAHEISR